MIQDVYQRANKSELLKRDTRWTLVFEDFEKSTVDTFVGELKDQTNLLRMTTRSCCKILNERKLLHGIKTSCSNVY